MRCPGPWDHTWTPIDGECGQYRCACGAAGYRNGIGVIVPHKIQGAGRASRWSGIDVGWKRAERAPSLDDYDREGKPWRNR